MAIFGKSTPREAEGDKGRALPPEAAPSPRFEPASQRTEAKAAVIGPHVKIQGELSGDEDIVIAGKIVGNVTAVERVELLASGQLEGNIRAPKIVIAEGAQFKGSVDMGAKTGAPEAASPPKAPMSTASPTSPAPPTGPGGGPAR